MFYHSKNILHSKNNGFFLINQLEINKHWQFVIINNNINPININQSINELKKQSNQNVYHWLFVTTNNNINQINKYCGWIHNYR